LTPSKIVAPINSEVVLLAGICGEDGRFVTKQPVEWMLSPDSVGNILGLSEGKYSQLARLTHTASRKECNAFAITHTSHAAQRVTRGTQQPNDDVFVSKGQTWISVSSPTEGISHVTALARGEENWEFRRQTATIHWVDLQWSFPAPQIAQAGRPVQLSTAVSRTSTGSAAAGVLVRYDIVEGAASSFFGDGRTSLELQTNENGRADVPLVQSQPGPGTTKVRVQILSADMRTGADRAVIGQGFTTITWSAPGLAISVTGGNTVARGSVVTFHVDVSNPGDLATNNVTVQAEIPAALKFLNSQPPVEVFGATLSWRLGSLGPQEVRRLVINCQTANAGEVGLVVRAASPNLTTEAIGRATVRIVESSLSVRFVNPPVSAAVGQVVGFNFEVTNTGRTELQNVLIRDTFDPGLQPNIPGVDPNRPVEIPSFSLAPGETVQKGISFIPRRAGQLCHSVEVTAAGGHLASQRVCIDVTQAVMRIDVQKRGPQQASVGDQVPFTLSITNTGDSVLSNIRITDTPDGNLRPYQGSDGFRVVDGSIVWAVDTLGPNQTVQVELVCLCERESPSAVNTVQVTADGGVRQTATANVAIGPAVRPAQPIPAQPPATTERSGPADAGGEFRVKLVGLSNGIPLGEVGKFFIILTNERNIDESDVVITLQLPQGLEFVKHSWTAPLPILSDPNNRQTIELGPINSIAARQTNLIPITIELRGRTVGDYEIRVQVRARNLPQPVQSSVATFVRAN
jgi:uncharacterized repeat protein (TIGR01451 family)